MIKNIRFDEKGNMVTRKAGEPFSLTSPRRKPVQRELKLQNQIVEYLNLTGVFCWVTFQPYFHGNKGYQFRHFHHSSAGVADIIGIYKGRPMAVEVKCKGNKPSEKQVVFLDQFAKAGGLAFVAYSLDDVVNHIRIG